MTRSAPDPLILTLARLRQARGLSQRQVARAMYSSQSVVCELESGLVNPKLLTLRRYARAIGYDLGVNPL